MRGIDKIMDKATGNDKRTARKQFIRSLEETAARAVVTATVTFAVGWILKKMFEKSVAEAAEEGAKAGVEDHLADDNPNRVDPRHGSDTQF